MNNQILAVKTKRYSVGVVIVHGVNTGKLSHVRYDRAFFSVTVHCHEFLEIGRGDQIKGKATPQGFGFDNPYEFGAVYVSALTTVAECVPLQEYHRVLGGEDGPQLTG